jgi:hypothetical protein
MSTAMRNAPLPRQASAGDDPAVDARIAAIIAENAGPKAYEPARLSRNTPSPHARRDGRRDDHAEVDAGGNSDGSMVAASP